MRQPGRLLFLAVVSLVSVQAQPPDVRPEFEVASVKPNLSGSANFLMRPPVDGRFTATNVTLKLLIALAYKVRQLEIVGGPAWIDSARYDVNAKAASGNANDDQSRLMLQLLLKDRFQLKVHREMKQMPVYELLPAKNGLKVSASKEGSCAVFTSASAAGSTSGPPSTPFCGALIVRPNGIAGNGVTMAQLANSLSGIVGPPVIDKTGYTGHFDFHLEFNREAAADTSEPSIFTALQEQLGMKLEAKKGPVEVLVIDNAGKASAN